MTATAAEATAAVRAAACRARSPTSSATRRCERFSFYGMRNILMQFLVSSVMLLPTSPRGRSARARPRTSSTASSSACTSSRCSAAGWRTASSASTTRSCGSRLVYCAGHACLAMFEDNRTGFYTGLFLIALGSGGIKPWCRRSSATSSTRRNKHLAKIVFDAFYWIINFGSFFASLLMPLFLRNYGPGGRLRHPGRADVRRDGRSSGWGASSTCACRRAPPGSALVPARRAHRADRAGAGPGPPGPGRGGRRRGAGVVMLLCWAIGPACWPEDFGFVITRCAWRWSR